MWIEVRGAAKPFWLDTDQCRLPNGELAFAYENQKPAIPSWFAAPPASKLRETSENLWAWYNMHEHRSLRCSVQEVLAFYEDSIGPVDVRKRSTRALGLVLGFLLTTARERLSKLGSLRAWECGVLDCRIRGAGL